LFALGCQSSQPATPSLKHARPSHPASDTPSGAASALPHPTSTTQAAPALKPFSQEVPAAAFRFDLVPIPASSDSKIKPFYLAKTELTWEAFDPFVFRLDEEDAPSPTGADAVTRPSKPYLPPDRGLGHEGYAAISMSFANAQAYCQWLSAKSGRKYRLPTVAEWQHACSAPLTTEGDKPKPLAWLAGNSGGVPHPVATTAPNSYGLCDMRGNVMEWCTNEKGEGVACGGCYNDQAATCTTVQAFDPEWNKSDPQIPKSKWWLADGPFVGFRVVCEP
jgi:formylglycine-generating enzyme required for sulfatase activity